MKSVPVFEAKNRLSELLVLVESGEEIAITRRGLPIARLVAAGAGRAADESATVADAFHQLEQLRSTTELAGDLKVIARAGLD